MWASYSPQSELRLAFGIYFSFRSRGPLYQPLQSACSLEDSGHTDLSLLAPSSALSAAVPLMGLIPRRE